MISNRLQACEALMSEEKQRLSKLKKQKTGLMHDLLTGKVTVKLDGPQAAHV
jgi:hypothetical protein